MILDLADEKSILVKVTINYANVDPDLCHHMASLGQNELIFFGVIHF